MSSRPERAAGEPLLLLRKVTKGALGEGFSFPEKPGKSAFRFAKSIRDGFNVTFSLVRKSNQKRRFLCSFCFCKKNQKAAGAPPCDLGSKRYTGMLFIEIVAFRV